MIETKEIVWTPDPGMDDAAQYAHVKQEIDNQAFAGWLSGGAFKVGGVWRLIFQRAKP